MSFAERVKFCGRADGRLLDDRLVARTGWTKAAEGGATPFWGEQFNLTEVPHFSTCSEYEPRVMPRG